MREARQVTQPDVVLERHSPDASCHVQIWRHAASHLAMAIINVEVDFQRWSVDPVAAKRRPEAIDINEPRTVGGAHSGEERAIETRIDDVARSASTAVDWRNVDINADADRHPREDRVYGNDRDA